MEIEFRKNISPLGFEKTLIKDYKKSKKESKVIFNFKQVEGIGIFELGLLSLWIRELSEKPIEVSFLLPIDKVFIAFLSRYRFIDTIKSYSVTIDKSVPSVPDNQYTSTAYLPIKFYSEQEFEKMLLFLKNNKNYEKFVEDLVRTRVMQPNVFRNVILTQLGENIFKHAKGKYPIILMTKSRRKEETLDLFKEKNNKGEDNYSNCFSSESDYIKDIGWSNLITIVIADKGQGIANSKLKKAYIEDLIIPKSTKKKNPSSFDLIEYAFLEHSTTSDPQDRFAEQEELLETFNKNSE